MRAPKQGSKEKKDNSSAQKCTTGKAIISFQKRIFFYVHSRVLSSSFVTMFLLS